MKITLWNGRASPHSIGVDLKLDHWTQQISVLNTQAPMPAGVSAGFLRTYSFLFSLGQQNETIRLTGRVYSEAERKELEDAVRSWYYFATPATATALQRIIDWDDCSSYEGLLGPLAWSKIAGTGDQWSYSVAFFVINYVHP